MRDYAYNEMQNPLYSVQSKMIRNVVGKARRERREMMWRALQQVFGRRADQAEEGQSLVDGYLKCPAGHGAR